MTVPDSRAADLCPNTETRLLTDADVMLRRALAGRAFQPVIAYGPRSAAHRRIAGCIEQRARELGFLTFRFSAARKTPFTEILTPELTKLWDAFPDAADDCAVALSGLKAMPLTVTLPDIFASLGKALRNAGTGWVIAAENLHLLPRTDFPALTMALHRVAQNAAPIVFVGIGTPSLFKAAADSTAYADRLFRFYQLSEKTAGQTGTANLRI